MCRNNYMKCTTLPYPIFQPFHPRYAKLNLYPYIFSHFKKFHSSLLLKHIRLRYRSNNYGLSNKATEPMLFKVIQYGYETSQNVAPILHSVICSEMDTAWITSKRQGLVKSSYFLWKLLLFIVNRFYYLLYNSICILSYWESIVTHKFIMVK